MRALFGPVALCTFLAACGSGDSTSVPPPSSMLVVSPTRVVLGDGMSRRLSVAVLDQSGAPITDAAVSFSTTDPSRTFVTGDGVVSFVGVGQAEIHASSEDLLVAVPYTGLGSGHPLGAVVTSTRLPGDRQGDGPFGVAVDADGRVLISQTNSGRVASTLYPVTEYSSLDLGGLPTTVALLAGGLALVTPTGPDTNDASLVEVSTGRSVAQIALDVPAFSAVVSPDSGTVYLGTNDGRVLVFDVASSSVTRAIDLGVSKSRANHLALNADGTTLFASSFTTGTISEIDLASGSASRLLIVGGEPQGIAVSPDGRELYVANEAGTGEIEILDIVDNVIEAEIPSGATSGIGGPFGLTMSPDGSAVYVGVIATEGPGLIQVIDASTHTIARTIQSCGSTPRRIAFGYSGGLAVITDEAGCVNFVE